MGSFPVDIDLRIDASSALKAYQTFTSKANALMKDVAAGVEGAQAKLTKATEDFGRAVISTSTRSGRAIESSIRALERQAEVAGKTRSEQLLVRQEKWIKALGQDEAAIKRVTAAFQQLIKVEDEEARKQTQHGGGAGGLLFRGARDIFEGRMAYGVMDVGRAAGQMFGGGAGAGAAGGLAGAAGAGLALGGLAAAFVGIEAAGYAAAKSLAEYGTQIRDVGLRTGLSAREVGQFSFAAKVVGQDVSITERLMRGLSQAADDASMDGEKARKMFERLHITLVDNITGAMKPTSQMLEEIGEKLAGLPAGVERDAAAMAMFKRAGVEAVPFMTELAENLKIAREHGYGPSEEEIARFKEYQLTLAEVETNWSEFKRTMLEPLAMVFNITVRILGKSYDAMQVPGDILGQALFGGKQTATDREMGETGGYGYGASESRSAHAAEARSIKLNDQMVALARSTEENKKLTLAEKELATLQASTKLGVLPSVNAPTFAAITAKKAEIVGIKAAIEAERQAKEDQKAIVEALRRAGLLEEQRKENQFLLPAEKELNTVLRLHGLDPNGPQANELRRRYAGQIGFEREQQTDRLATQRLEVQQTFQRELLGVKQAGVLPVDVRQLGEGGVTRVDVEKEITDQYYQRVENAKQTHDLELSLINARKIETTDTPKLAKQEDDREAAAYKERLEDDRATLAIKILMHKLGETERSQEQKHTEEMSKIQLADQEESIKHGADLARRQAALRFKGDSPAAGIAEEYRIAVTEAQQLYDWEVNRIALHETGDKAIEDNARALHQLHREDEKASEDAQFRMAEMQQKQLDTLKGKIEPLYQTLFTNPSKFGAQLRSTIMEAALHPIVSGLSEMTATALYPTFFGATGTGGLANMFKFGGGRHNEAKVTPEGAMLVQEVNRNTAPINFFGGGGGGRGGGTTIPLPPYFGRGGGGDGGGYYFPGSNVFTDSSPGGTTGFNGPVNLSGGGYGGSSWTQQIQNLPARGLGISAPAILAAALGGVGGGGDGSTAPLHYFGQGGVSGRTVDPVTGVLQKGMGWLGKYLGGSPTGGTWGSMGSTMSGTLAGYGGAFGGTAQQGLKALSTGPFAGTPAGGMAAGLGLSLAATGIFGEQRGRLGGIAEAAGGGFLVAGPIGAAVGAAIGVGEMLAGVEAPRYEAKRLVQQIYHISINNTTADQIVAIANQSYAGRVSIAVRSPEVRHMLGLYAAGTGQGNQFNQGVTEAHGASLVESGGVLSQQATYGYGQAFTYGSSLPVYGGTPTHVLGAPGGGVNLSLNIGGQDAASFLTGNVVSPSVVQTQFAAAMNASSGRVAQSLLMSDAGQVIAS